MKHLRTFQNTTRNWVSTSFPTSAIDLTAVQKVIIPGVWSNNLCNQQYKSINMHYQDHICKVNLQSKRPNQ